MDIITINDYSKIILNNYYEEFMHKFSDAITYTYNKHVIKTKVLYNKTNLMSTYFFELSLSIAKQLLCLKTLKNTARINFKL